MLFLNPSSYHGYRFPSMALASLAAVLRRDGVPVEVIDSNYDPEWRRRLAERAPAHPWFGVTANVLSIGPALEAVRIVREAAPQTRIVLGGPYPSVEYESLLKESADAVVIGEGEETIRALAAGRALAEIPGLAWRDNGNIVVNQQRKLIENLDALPLPAWDLMPVSQVRLSHSRNNPTLPIMTSRGCPYNCIFCGTNVIFHRRMRLFSIDRVIEEIDHLERCGARELHFWDDNFTLDPARAIALCDRIAARKSKLTLSSVSGIRPDIGGDDLFRAMKRAGFYHVCIAYESGDADILRKLRKPTDLSKVRPVLEAANRAGLLTNGFFMLGLPFDTPETMRRTVAFACSLPLDLAQFFITIPFPGTELHDIVARDGRFIHHAPDERWTQGYFMGRATFEMPAFDAATVERTFRAASRRFFLQPGRILRLLRKRIRRPADIPQILAKAWYVVSRGRQFA